MRVVSFAGLTLLVVALSLLALWFGQRRLIYFPSVAPPPAATTIHAGAVDARFVTAEGVQLGGWFFPRNDGELSPVVLVMNGNAGSRAGRLPLALGLARHGLAVMLFDYRGYGGNPGSPTEQGLLSDARAARQWLVSQPGVDPDGIVYFGESLGAAVAVALASEQPPAALILRSPFTSLAEVGDVHYPWLPVRHLLRDRFPSIDRIRRVSCPILVIAGEEDGIVPPAQSRRLYEAAPAPRKRFVSIPGAGHNDPMLTSGDPLTSEVASFLFDHTRN